MPETTPNQGWPYPDGSDANNIGRDFKAFVLAVDTSTGLQGPLDQRPAAGKRGRFYWATNRLHPTTNARIPWNVLYRDDGSQWRAVNKSAWLDYAWTWGVVGSPGFSLSLVQDARTVNRYRYDDYECTYEVSQLVALTGTDAPGTVSVTLPIPAIEQTAAFVQGQNEIQKSIIDPVQQLLTWDPSSFHNGGKWIANGGATWFRANVTYRIA